MYNGRELSNRWSDNTNLGRNLIYYSHMFGYYSPHIPLASPNVLVFVKRAIVQGGMEVGVTD